MKRLWYWIKRLRKDIFILYYANQDPRASKQVKILTVLLLAYIISPFDILPEMFLPGIGYLDDLMLIPLGIETIVKMIPLPVFSAATKKSMHIERKLIHWAIALGIIFMMILLYLMYRLFKVT